MSGTSTGLCSSWLGRRRRSIISEIEELCVSKSAPWLLLARRASAIRRRRLDGASVREPWLSFVLVAIVPRRMRLNGGTEG